MLTFCVNQEPGTNAKQLENCASAEPALALHAAARLLRSATLNRPPPPPRAPRRMHRGACGFSGCQPVAGSSRNGPRIACPRSISAPDEVFYPRHPSRPAASGSYLDRIHKRRRAATTTVTCILTPTTRRRLDVEAAMQSDEEPTQPQHAFVCTLFHTHAHTLNTSDSTWQSHIGHEKHRQRNGR